MIKASIQQGLKHEVLLHEQNKLNSNGVLKIKEKISFGKLSGKILKPDKLPENIIIMSYFKSKPSNLWKNMIKIAFMRRLLMKILKQIYNFGAFKIHLCCGYLRRDATVILIVLPFVYYGFAHFTVHLRISSFFSMRILQKNSIVSEPMVNER